MAVTAKRDNMRLLAVVLGEETASVRNSETASLLDYGFNNYKVNVIKKMGDVIETKKIDKANSEKIDIVLKNNVTQIIKKGEENISCKYNSIINEINLPIKKGDIVGKYLVDCNKYKLEYNLTVNKDIDKLNIFKLYLKYIKNVVGGYE